MNTDLRLFNAIHGYAKKSKMLDVLAVWCAEYLGYILLGLFCIFAIATHQWRLFLIPFAAGVFSRFILTEGVYLVYKRKRPLEVLSITALIKKPNHPAFPSGHAAFFFAVSFALLLFNLPLAIIGIIASLIIGKSRIFCGVHWPSDIVAGIVSAGITFFIVQQFI